MPPATGDVHQVCGPISTGGLGTRELNNARFALAIERAQANGLLVFNQLPFQEALVRLSRYPEPGYNELNLEEFYGPIFACGHVRRVLFLSDWQTSRGARWERERAAEHAITIDEYPEHWLA